VRCTLETAAHDSGRASFTIPQLPTEVEPVPDDAIIAMALGVAAADIGEFRPACWTAGLPFTFVTLTSRAAVERCRPDPVSFDSAFGTGGAAYVVCRQTVEPGHSFHARMFAPGMGVPEDPATGSAAAAFAGLLASHLSDGTHPVTIEQGYEMGRPSLMRLVAVVEAGRVLSASIGGDAVVVTEGTIEA
jgi:trans-2,3-dihydro-3-hydroxyanthranilate isomerase